MKKSLIVTVLMASTILLGPTPYILAQNSNSQMDTLSNWSIEVKTGVNYFRSNPSPSKFIDRVHPILGGAIDYTINPLVGIGLELLSNPFGGEVNSTTTLDGSTFDVVPYVSVNLSNLLFANRQGLWKKISLYESVGLGVGFYNYSINNASVTNSKTMLASLSSTLEYKMSQHWSLDLEGQYRYYDRANMAGGFASKGNCEALTASLGLRYKFGAGTKTHARNVVASAFSTLSEPIKQNDFAKDALAQLSDLEKQNTDLEKKLNDLEGQLKPKPVVKQEPVVVKPTLPSSFQSIEFNFDSSKLTQNSYSTLDKMALLLNNGTWSALKVFGNTDSLGSAEYNQKLSEYRASMVKDYLVKKSVPSSKISTVGNGEEKPVATNETEEGRQKNRRVDFEITF